MEPFKQRVVDEYRELQEKMKKLSGFIKESPIFVQLPPAEQHRLQSQYYAMLTYAQLLWTRIESWQ